MNAEQLFNFHAKLIIACEVGNTTINHDWLPIDPLCYLATYFLTFHFSVEYAVKKLFSEQRLICLA